MITLIVPIQNINHRIVFVEGKRASVRLIDGEWVFSIPSGLNLPINVEFGPVLKPEIRIESGSVAGLVLFSILILTLVFWGGDKSGKGKE